MNKITTKVVQNASADVVTVIGIDLAKNVFALHGINVAGQAILVRPSVRREQLLDVLAQLPPCLIGMEARTGGRMAGFGSRSIQLRRQGQTGQGYQGGRPVFTYAVDSGCALGAGNRSQQNRCDQPLGDCIGSTCRLWQGVGGYRRQECAHGVGDAGERTGISFTSLNQKNRKPKPVSL